MSFGSQVDEYVVVVEVATEVVVVLVELKRWWRERLKIRTNARKSPIDLRPRLMAENPPG
jgi:hypothetical protein